MTSVVKGLSMSEVRRCLQEIRRSWDDHSPWMPFNPSNTLEACTTQNMSMTQFTWMFVSGHHAQRKRSRSTARNRGTDR